MSETARGTVRSTEQLRRAVARWRRAGGRVGLVPTMGALHDGHLALIRAARARRLRVVVSIFVNPRQFGPGEDFARYPRDEAADIAKARGAGAELAFIPDVETIYPPGFATLVHVGGLSGMLEGKLRPGHFDGVATVVAKLLLLTLPDYAFFGEKDYQQLLVVKHLVRDLAIPVGIVGVPTVREADGLALSSRNVYLSAAERRIAPALAATLRALAATLGEAAAPVAEELGRGRASLSQAGFADVDYLELRDAETLEPVATVTRPARLVAAVRLGATRLIDNVPVVPGRPGAEPAG